MNIIAMGQIGVWKTEESIPHTMKYPGYRELISGNIVSDLVEGWLVDT